MAVTLNDRYLSSFINADEYKAIAPQVKLAHDQLHQKNGMGSDFTGWVELPSAYDREEFARIKKAAK